MLATAALVAFVSAAAPQITTTPAVDAPRSPWEAWAALATGAPLVEGGGLGAVGTLAATYDLKPWIHPELGLGLGAFSAPMDLMMRFGVGARFLLPLESAQPYLWLGTAHVHEVGAHAAHAQPVAAALSLSNVVHHRQDIQAGFGVNIPIVATGGSAVHRQRFDLSLRVTGSGFVDEGGPRAFLMGEVGIGLPL